MRTLLLSLSAIALLFGGEPHTAKDSRVEQRQGYHIINRPVREGETPPEVKQKAEDDTKRKRSNQDLGDQSPPTRQPELKPKEIKP